MKLQLVKIQPGFRALALSAAVLLTLGSSVLAADAPESWVRLDVPFVPTPPIVMEAMLKAASVGANDVLYDLGSGDGRIAIAAARAYGVKKAVGIDLNPKRVAEAEANAKVAGVADRVSFIQGDVFKADFTAATVVTMYLLDNVNLRLRPRILNELRPSTRIVSHQFHMFDWPPDNTVMVLDQVPVHFWVVPAKVQGSWHGKIGDDAVALDLAQKFQLVTGDLAVGDARGRIAQAKMTGDILALEGSVTRSGKAEPLRFEGKVTKKALTGTLTLGGAAHSVALQRAAESSR